MVKCNECNQENDVMYFHSSCCNAHFEGLIIDGKYYIACEKCMELVGELK